MRLKYIFFLILSLLIFPDFIYADMINSGTEYGTYDDAKKIIKEVMRDYYIRGSSFQYNYSKATYGIDSPEEITSQDNKYTVCAAYTYDVYKEAFGVYYDSDNNSLGYHQNKFPIYTYKVLETAKQYYESGVNNKNLLDGNLLLYYQNVSDNKKYVYGDSDQISDIVNLIQPGDLFIYTGHVMIAYDKVSLGNGEYDILMLNSSRNDMIQTRIDASTSRMSYDFHNPDINMNGEKIENVINEGTVKQFYLRQNDHFVKDDVFGCYKENECAIIRPFYKNSSGKAIFNYSIRSENYDRSVLRTKYPGLFIEKTVSCDDNNSIYLNDFLTYTISITNKSNVDIDSSGTNYNKFYVVEELGDLVNYVSASNNGVYDQNKVTWMVDRLNINETINLSYTVKVKNNILNVNKNVIATGKFYQDNNSYITTGTINNKIIARAFKINNIKDCYDANKDNYLGLELINKIYRCTNNNNDINFTEFNFEEIIEKKSNLTNSSTANAISLKDTNNQFTKMILNNYWGGLVEYQSDSGSYLNLPNWSGNSAKIRAKTINQADFKDGDVLIYEVVPKTYDASRSSAKYTSENGLYAYVYIDGKFIGNNDYGGNSKRNEYTFNYYLNNSYYSDKDLKKYFYDNYSSELSSDVLEFINYQTLYDKDYYVVLRPMQLTDVTVITDNSIKVDNSNRIIYRLDKDTNIELLNRKITNNYINITNNSDEMFKTGDDISVLFGIESSPLTYKLSIKGDVLGSGNPSIDDVKKIARYVIDKSAITENEKLKSADYNGDDKIKMNDVVKLLADIK